MAPKVLPTVSRMESEAAAADARAACTFGFDLQAFSKGKRMFNGRRQGTRWSPSIERTAQPGSLPDLRGGSRTVP